jgi:hypothetical protein
MKADSYFLSLLAAGAAAALAVGIFMLTQPSFPVWLSMILVGLFLACVVAGVAYLKRNHCARVARQLEEQRQSYQQRFGTMKSGQKFLAAIPEPSAEPLPATGELLSFDEHFIGSVVIGAAIDGARALFRAIGNIGKSAEQIQAEKQLVAVMEEYRQISKPVNAFSMIYVAAPVIVAIALVQIW